MKILIITEGFFPGEKYGGPPVSIDNFCSLMKDCKIYILTTNHDYMESKPYKNIKDGWNKRTNCLVKYLDEKKYNKREFEKTILEIKPDVIYLQSLFQRCIFPILYISHKKNIRLILAPRGELCLGALKKLYKKIPYIYVLKTLGLFNGVIFQSTSNEESLAIKKYLKVNDANIKLLSNVPSIPKKSFVRKEKKEGCAKFVFLSRIHPKKNLKDAIKYLSKIHGKISFDIYGPIEDEKYWMQCKEEINLLPNNIVVEYCGIVSHEKVHEILSRYDAFIFPTLSENYGHVIVEALMVGTPVIISDKTPWNDLQKYKAGWALPLDEEEQFVMAIQKIVDTSDDIYNINAKKYIEKKCKIMELKKQYEVLFKC